MNVDPIREAPRPPRGDDASIKEMALAIAQAGLDKKAFNVDIIDVRGKVDYADYVIVMSARSDRQVNAVAKGVESAVKAKFGQTTIGSEGQRTGQWVLLDFGDVVVHVFYDEARRYYDLDNLWFDADRIEVPGQERRSDLDFDTE